MPGSPRDTSISSRASRCAGATCRAWRGAREESIADVRERRRCPGSGLRAMESTLAEMAMRLEAGRVLLCRAAYLKDTGRPFRAAASMAKLMCSEAAMWVTTKAVQLQGRAGVVRDRPTERYLRDAKLGEIGEGTSEMQRRVIARALLTWGLPTLSVPGPSPASP